MDNYDQTNKGVFFKPFPDQKLVGSGKINIEGRETRIVAVMERMSPDKPPIWVLYERLGPLFNNESETENAPDKSGPIDNPPGYRVAAWKGEKDGKPYYSLKVSQREGASGSAPSSPQHEPVNDLDDEIPF